MADAPLPNWPRVLDEEKAAAYVSLGVSTFRREVAAGRIPPPVQLTAGRVGWDIRALDRWVDERAPGAPPSSSNPWDAITGGGRAA